MIGYFIITGFAAATLALSTCNLKKVRKPPPATPAKPPAPQKTLKVAPRAAPPRKKKEIFLEEHTPPSTDTDEVSTIPPAEQIRIVENHRRRIGVRPRAGNRVYKKTPSSELVKVENKKSVEKNCKVVKTESGEAEACEKKEDKRNVEKNKKKEKESKEKSKNCYEKKELKKNGSESYAYKV
ncbi:uncharacterized protein CELE_B0524.5 [Caenorhabditis elegans]|uniref:Uncharacterized protein n=1 Tax=Caenorhabditis elegans TaxID=6239 RepID=Q9N5Z8_CAEEL|nr:Uncharacterized protein CELE_B0524.5 [Caenorhabditis elegans]CCD62147.1 Uncharacterized protein CELE_B0524.5 [Caenorhabditis elegans]|eukprot:NP_497473.2 Uncharacterized protein CELE_B0524.5 [Caenorhabditis elegans]